MSISAGESKEKEMHLEDANIEAVADVTTRISVSAQEERTIRRTV